MNKAEFIDKILNHDVVFLAHNAHNNSFDRIQIVASAFTGAATLKRISRNLNDQASLNDGVISFKRSHIKYNIDDIIKIVVNRHDTNILYINGEEFASAFYIIEGDDVK